MIQREILHEAVKELIRESIIGGTALIIAMAVLYYLPERAWPVAIGFICIWYVAEVIHEKRQESTATERNPQQAQTAEAVADDVEPDLHMSGLLHADDGDES